MSVGWLALAGVVGIAVGWSLHGLWLRRLITINAVRHPDGRIVGWTVNFGRPVVGYHRAKAGALRHHRRILDTIRGRERGTRYETDGDQVAGDA